MTFIKLFCLVDGESTFNAFPVEIDPNQTIGDLKNLVKIRKSPRFDSVAADELTLWRVSILIPDVDDDEAPILLNSFDEKKKLGPATRVCKLFSEVVPDETIHIIIQRPPPAVDLTSDAKFFVSVKGKDTEPWEWESSLSTATLEDLRQHIYAKHCIPEDERRGIVIEHAKSPLFRNGGVDRLLGDARLRTLLKMYVKAGLTHMVVHLEFLSKGFSKFSLADVYERLGVNKFEPFEVGKMPCDTEERQAVLKELKGAINLARRSTQFTNEACATRYVGPYFMAVISLNQKLCLTPEREISGRWGAGPVDYSIESRNATELYMVGVTEVKTTKTLLSGFPQNAMQLDAALTTFDAQDMRCNSRPLVSYGIVTDAKTWEFVECRMESMEATATIQGPPIIRRAELPVIVDYDDENWAENMQEVFEHILWFVEMMSQDIPTTKRIKANGSLKKEP
ncbi:hypothetical protein BGZ72_000229 [Mortierella alpina]|nr:hypothetical protein BGZ72_000229 [Mortierella alpina]